MTCTISPSWYRHPLLLLTLSAVLFQSQAAGQVPWKPFQLPAVLGDLGAIDEKLSELDFKSPKVLSEELGFLKPSRGQLRKLMDSNKASRRTQEQEGCQVALLQMLPPPKLKEFWECQRTKMATVDNGVVGSALDVGATCWCDHKVKEAIDALGCCSHPDFKMLCELQCEPDCASAAAQQCLEQCPPMCLEQSLAAPTCQEDCASGECHRYMLCITEHSKNQTQLGNLEKTCDEKALTESKQVADYIECQTAFPKRTYWQRKNAQMHCACKESLGSATTESKCCDESWAGGICDLKCAASQDCTSSEAQQCLASCRKQCTFQLEGTDAPPVWLSECHKSCLSSKSTCHLYATCEPLEQLSFEYICDDGESPSTNGCCAVPYVTKDGKQTVMTECPTLCDSRQAHMLPHGPECLCQGCPKSADEMKAKYKAVLEKALWINGQQILLEIAHMVQLERGPTSEMQRLMAERNEKLMEAYLTAQSNAEAEASMMKINDSYVTLIAEAAKAARDPDATLKAAIESGDKDKIAHALTLTAGAGANPALEAEAEAKRDELEGKAKKEEQEKSAEESKGLGIGVVLGIVAGVVIFMSVGFAIVWFTSKKSKDVPVNYEANPASANGTTVVVGQPVTGGQATSGAPAQDAVQGAPMGAKTSEKPV